MSTRQDTSQVIASAYLIAKQAVVENGFANEITWQESATFENVSESDFLRESAWVILCSGFREQVVRRKFGAIGACYFEWESGRIIVDNAELCMSRALELFNHPGKISAIVQVSTHIVQEGLDQVLYLTKTLGTTYLEALPYIGPVTSLHLAKNLGLPVAKPDRHLRGLARDLGFESANSMCQEISSLTLDPIQVVDIVLWRFCTLYPQRVSRFTKLIASSGSLRG